jgi:hypothetical protein
MKYFIATSHMLLHAQHYNSHISIDDEGTAALPVRHSSPVHRYSTGCKYWGCKYWVQVVLEVLGASTGCKLTCKLLEISAGTISVRNSFTIQYQSLAVRYNARASVSGIADTIPEHQCQE